MDNFQNKLCQLLNITNKGLKELTDIAIIAGDVISYVLGHKDDYNLRTFKGYVDIYVITNNTDTTHEENQKLHDSVCDILHQEMKQMKKELSYGEANLYLEPIKNELRSFRPVPQNLTNIFITIINEEYTPEELVSKFLFEHEECYYYKGNFWISDKANLALESRISGFKGDPSLYNEEVIPQQNENILNFTFVQRS